MILADTSLIYKEAASKFDTLPILQGLFHSDYSTMARISSTGVTIPLPLHSVRGASRNGNARALGTDKASRERFSLDFSINAAFQMVIMHVDLRTGLTFSCIILQHLLTGNEPPDILSIF